MWRRMPTWFPNLRLQMLHLTPEQQDMLQATGWLREAVFKCEPRTTKHEIKAFLKAVHGMEVERVNTINYQGKKKVQQDNQGKAHYYRRSDWKKAYVLFKPPQEELDKWRAQRAEQQVQRLRELQDAQRDGRRPNFSAAAATAVARDAAPAVLENYNTLQEKLAAARLKRRMSLEKWKQKLAEKKVARRLATGQSSQQQQQQQQQTSQR